jgi:hypothetical protein
LQLHPDDSSRWIVTCVTLAEFVRRKSSPASSPSRLLFCGSPRQA